MNLPHRSIGALVAAFLLVGLSACGGTLEVIADRPLAETAAPKGIIIFPVGVMRPDATPLEYIARADDVGNWLLRHTELPVIGPFDYKLFQPPDEARVASTSTNLMTRNDDQVDLKGWLSLGIMITENRASNVRDLVDNRKNAKKKGQVYRQHGVEATVRIELNLYDAMRGKHIAEVVVKDTDDVTMVPEQGDPRPGVRRLLLKGMQMLFAQAAPLLEGAPMRRVRAGFAPAVPKFANFAVPGKASYMDKFRDKDDTDKQAATIALWDRFSPGLPVKATYVAGKTHGLLALEKRAPLEQYDVIISVGGKPVYTMVQLDRRLAACGMAGCEVLIKRGFTEQKVHINWQAVPKLDEPEEK